MKKTLIVFLSVFFLLIGCSKSEEKVTKEVNTETAKQEKEQVVIEEVNGEETPQIKDIKGIAEHYKNNGYDVVAGDKPFFTIIGAIDGEKWTINNLSVEVYKYKSEDEAKSYVEVMQTQLEDQGTVMSNKEFLMIFHNPIDENIMNTFKSIK